MGMLNIGQYIYELEFAINTAKEARVMETRHNMLEFYRIAINSMEYKIKKLKELMLDISQEVTK